MGILLVGGSVMYELNLDSKGKKQRKALKMYDLTLDRRVSGRRDDLFQPLEGVQYFERRHGDRRMDTRALRDFPFLPEAIL